MTEVELDAWIQHLLALPLRDRIAAVLPLAEALLPGWEEAWRVPEDLAIARRGRAALRGWLAGDPPPEERLLELALELERIAQEVGESAQAIDGEEGAMSAHVVSAFLATALHAVSGRDDALAHSLEEVLEGIAYMRDDPLIAAALARVPH